MGNTQPIKGSGSSPPQSPRTEKEPTVNFEQVALGQATGKLTGHGKLALEQLHAAPSNAAVTFEQLQSRRGLTKGAKCIVRNFDPRGPVGAAFCQRLAKDHEINVKLSLRKDGAVKLTSNVPIEKLAAALEREFNLLNNLHRFGTGKNTMASLLSSELYLPPCLRNSVEPFKISSTEIRLIVTMIDHGFYELSSRLLDIFASDPDFEFTLGGEYGKILDLSLDKFRELLTKRGVDVNRYIAPKGARYTRSRILVSDLKVLLCIDLCTKQPNDPIQAARIVLNHLSENDKALPYQDEVMAAVSALAQTPDDAESLVQSLTKEFTTLTPAAQAWLKPLTDSTEDRAAFIDAYGELMASGKVKEGAVRKGRGNLPDIVDLEPVGKMDTRAIMLLISAVKSGMSLVKEMGQVLGAFTLLARITLAEGGSDLRRAVEKLGAELLQKIFDNPEFDHVACEHAAELAGDHIWSKGQAKVN